MPAKSVFLAVQVGDAFSKCPRFIIRSRPSSQVSQAAWALAVVWETMDFLAREYLYRSMTGLSPSVFL